MKKLAVIGLISFISLSVVSQSEQSSPTNEIVIGRNFKTNSNIKAKEYVFNENIISWHINDSTNLLTVQLRGTIGNENTLKGVGNIISYDLQGNKMRWNKEVDYLFTNINQYDNVLIKTTNNQSSCLNNEDGEILWNSKNTIYYVNPQRKAGVGYKYTTNTLEGIDLNTGKPMWSRHINREYGLNDIICLNDSVILVVANGLHSVNLKTGLGWDYNAHTIAKDYSYTVVANIFSVTFSILLGTPLVITSGHNLYTDLFSNVLTDSTGIYMADRSSIVRIDYQGNIVWKTNLSRDMVSKSSIFIKDKMLYMVNTGMAYMNGELTNQGKPFVAAFNVRDGKNVFLSTIGYKQTEINLFNVQQDTLVLLSKKFIFKYSLKDGSELWEQMIKKDSLGEITQFAGTNMYIMSDSVFTNKYLSDPAKVHLFTNTDNLLIFDAQLQMKKTIPIEDIYFCYLEKNGCKFLENGNSSIVIDNKGNRVAELNISGNAVLKGKKLFEVQGNSLVEIDMDQLIGN